MNFKNAQLFLEKWCDRKSPQIVQKHYVSIKILKVFDFRQYANSASDILDKIFETFSFEEALGWLSQWMFVMYLKNYLITWMLRQFDVQPTAFE